MGEPAHALRADDLKGSVEEDGTTVGHCAHTTSIVVGGWPSTGQARERFSSGVMSAIVVRVETLGTSRIRESG
jgi:hypothetical protein